jgi:Cu2+-exporting ATPase
MPHDYDRHAGHSVAMFRDKFWLSFALTIPTVIWSPEVQHWLGYTAPSFPGSTFIPAILGTTVFVYGGLVFLRGARGELADHKPGMMTLISLAIIVAFGTSLAATFGLFEIEVWWELASLITIMVLGHWLEMRAISQARGALNALAALLPDTAERVNGTELQTVPLVELHVDDIVLVRPGTRVPADGAVVEGGADVDESMITGESKAVSKGPGATVIAGTVASGGSLRVRGSSCRRNYFHLLVVLGGQTTRPDADGDRPHHCLPPRIGTRDSARDCHLNIARCAEWSPRKGQTGT